MTSPRVLLSSEATTKPHTVRLSHAIHGSQSGSHILLRSSKTSAVFVAGKHEKNIKSFSAVYLEVCDRSQTSVIPFPPNRQVQTRDSILRRLCACTRRSTCPRYNLPRKPPRTATSTATATTTAAAAATATATTMRHCPHPRQIERRTVHWSPTTVW